MRRILPLSLLTACLVLGLGAPAQAKDRCAYKGSKTIRQTSTLRLYGLGTDRYYVCVRANGRRFPADNRRSPDGTMLKSTLAPAGSFAPLAYTNYQNEDAAGLNVVVIDL